MLTIVTFRSKRESEDSVSSSQTEILRLTAQQDVLIRSEAQLKSELSAVQELLNAATAEKDALVDSATSAAALQKSMSLEITQLKESLATASESDARLSAAQQQNKLLQDEVDALKNQLKLEALKISEAHNNTAEELRNQLAASEAKEKKLTALLKTKMKELKDATTALQEAQSSSASSETELQTLYNEAVQARSQAESRLNQLKERCSSQEDKISGLLKEKNALQEEVFRQEYTQKELKAVTEDRDELRKRFLALENLHVNSESASSEQIQKLEKQLKESSAKCELVIRDSSSRCEALTLENTKLKELLKAANDSAAKLNEASLLLTTVQSENKQLRDETEALKNQLKEEAAKFEIQTEKLKKVQVLLKKVNTMNQEKDSKMSTLLMATERPKRFHIMARVKLLLSQENAAGCPDDWCCVLEDAPPSEAAHAASSKYRWVEKVTVDSWVSEGSSVISAWPQLLNESYTSQYDKMKERLEAEKDELKSQLEDISQQFSTYKQRAQAALKRIGNEDAKERQKQQEAATEKELQRVTQELSEAWAKVEELQSLLASSEEALKAKASEIIDWTQQASVWAERDDENKREIARLSGREKLLTSELDAQHQRNEIQSAQLLSSEQKYSEKVEEVKELVAKIAGLESQSFQFSVMTPSKQPQSAPVAVESKSASLPPQVVASDVVESPEEKNGTEVVDLASPVTNLVTPRKPEINGVTGDKLLLHHQVLFICFRNAHF